MNIVHVKAMTETMAVVRFSEDRTYKIKALDTKMAEMMTVVRFPEIRHASAAEYEGW